jgi:hypothetical protein
MRQIRTSDVSFDEYVDVVSAVEAIREDNSAAHVK